VIIIGTQAGIFENMFINMKNVGASFECQK